MAEIRMMEIRMEEIRMVEIRMVEIQMVEVRRWTVQEKAWARRQRRAQWQGPGVSNCAVRKARCRTARKDGSVDDYLTS